MWQTVSKDNVTGKQNQIEHDMPIGLKSVLPEGYEITVLADRGFSGGNLYESLRDLNLPYIL